MAYRFTNTDKWTADQWFSSLKPMSKLLFIYLCDNCDIAGFIEINQKRWANDIDCKASEIKSALDGLSGGLVISGDGECAYIKDYLKHQKKLPLNKLDNAYKGVMSRFLIYQSKFGVETIEELIYTDFKEYGKDIQNTPESEKDKEPKLPENKTWRTDYAIYHADLSEAFRKARADAGWIKERQDYHPNLNIIKSIEKSCKDFWATDTGWKWKIKKTKGDVINWRSTFNNSLTQKGNQVYKQRTEQNQHNNEPTTAKSRNIIE